MDNPNSTKTEKQEEKLNIDSSKEITHKPLLEINKGKDIDIFMSKYYYDSWFP